MPTVDLGNVRLNYLLEGRDDAPVLILSNSLGTDLGMWAPQMPTLLEHFRVLRYDTRGHGKSSVPPGPYAIADLASDVIGLMDGLNIEHAHFCGLSMGGMTGIWLGLHHADRLDKLILSNTAARIGPPETWNARIEKVNSEGMAAIVPAVLERWFTKDFQNGAVRQVGVVQDMLLQTSPIGYAASCAAVRDMDLRDELRQIKVPTMVIVGKADKATPPLDGRFIASEIQGTKFVELQAAHLSNWEVAQAFTRQIVDFLTD
ncbi:MAG: 3-oxoadipate enol-lactonase [Herminiimonas sp.]|nr:3-oxoadipate enol-lactonase [Herminiimonas sp.]